MNVEIILGKGKYKLTADENQFKLVEVGIAQDGKNKGQEVEKNPRYFPTLELVAIRLYELELSKSDASTLVDMLKCIRATRQLIKTAGWTKEDFK